LYTNSNFKRNYLENYNDSEHVKTKNAPFFMIFPNISFFHMVVNYWTGPLKDQASQLKSWKNDIFEKIMKIWAFFVFTTCSESLYFSR
jgi:hypothetical protein